MRDDHGQTNTRLDEQHRRDSEPPRQAESHRRGLRVICEIAWILISNPGARFTDLGPGYHHPCSPQRRTGAKIAEIERLNPGMKLVLIPIGPTPAAA